MDLNVMLDCSEHRIVFKEKNKKVETLESDGGHMVMNLELVGEWKDADARELIVNLVEKNVDIETRKGIEKVHTNLNHKSKEQMIYAYRNAGRLSEEVRKMINEVVEGCRVCKKYAKSKPKPAVAIPKATEFNSIVTIDLKEMGDKYILWMVCAATRYIQGKVLNNKKAESIVKALHSG